MNPQIERLYQIASKPERIILGLMSGTSLDGLDMALCRFRGTGLQTQVEVLQFATESFSPAFQDSIRQVFAKPQVAFQTLCLLNPSIGLEHARIINQTLAKWGVSNDSVDAIASHGQTVFHAPKIYHQLPNEPNGTLQIGDGDHIAVATGILTLSDFRQKHCAAGGEGAPLAVYGDYLLFSQPEEDRVLLNLGGIANFTFLPGHLDPDGVFATDTGPGNTLLDAYVQKHFQVPFDRDGKIAQQGNVLPDLLAALLDHPFFDQPIPKTTGPESFNLTFLHQAQERSQTLQANHPDVLATLARFTAQSVADAVIRWAPQWSPRATLWVSGGGAHHPIMQAHLKQLLPQWPVAPLDHLGISGDAKEAILFATLANETLAGGQTSFGHRPNVPSVAMGKISFPH